MNEFEEVERLLRERSRKEVENDTGAAALKPRVLAAMREAQRTRESTENGRTAKRALPLWAFASSAAAAVVLLTNLIASAVQAQPLQMARAENVAAMARELRQLVPELDEREALRQAVLLQARARTAEQSRAMQGGWARADAGELEP